MTISEAKIQVCQSITDHVKSMDCLNNINSGNLQFLNPALIIGMVLIAMIIQKYR